MELKTEEPNCADGRGVAERPGPIREIRGGELTERTAPKIHFEQRTIVR